LGANVATALAVNVGSAGAFVTNGGALGTPSSGTLTNCTGLPIVAGTTGTLSVARGGTGVTTSTGSGDVVLSASPTFTGTLNAATINTSGDITAGGNLRADNGFVASGSFAGIYTDLRYDGYMTGYNGWTGITIDGDLDVTGTKNFNIPHPLTNLSPTHRLIHSVIESPRINNKYSEMVRLVNGRATINIDECFNMTQGTFEALNRNCIRFTKNESGFAAVKSILNGAVLEIFCEDINSTDEVYWEVTGERKDETALNSVTTDENGRLIVEKLQKILTGQLKLKN